MTKTYTMSDAWESLGEFLAKTNPFTKTGNGWKVWLRDEDTSYKCVAILLNNHLAHSLKDGLIARGEDPANIEITRGGTIGINISSVGD